MCVVSRCFSVYITYREEKNGEMVYGFRFFFFLLLLFSSPEDVLPSNVNILLNMLIYFLYSYIQPGMILFIEKRGSEHDFFLGLFNSQIYTKYLLILFNDQIFFAAESIFFFKYCNSGILHWNQQNIICLSVRISFWKNKK